MTYSIKIFLKRRNGRSGEVRTDVNNFFYNPNSCNYIITLDNIIGTTSVVVCRYPFELSTLSRSRPPLYISIILSDTISTAFRQFYMNCGYTLTLVHGWQSLIITVGRVAVSHKTWKESLPTSRRTWIPVTCNVTFVLTDFTLTIIVNTRLLGILTAYSWFFNNYPFILFQ